MNSTSSPFEGAQWMWPGQTHDHIYNTYALFRQTFSLAQVPHSAPLFITADQSYRLYINGEYVGRGPARGFQQSWPYDEHDVARFLREGENIVAIRAYNPGFGTFVYRHEGLAGVLLSARWSVANEEFVLQSSDWKSRVQSGVKSHTVRTSVQLFPQEHIDLREESQSWKTLAFDDSNWQGAPARSTWNCPPWHDLEPRGIPPLRESFVLPQQLVATAEGDCAPGYQETRDVVSLRVAEGLEHQRVANSAIFRDGILTVSPGGKGRFRSFVFDLGKMMIGNLIVEVEGAQSGEILDFLYSETVREEDENSPQVTPLHTPEWGSLTAIGTRLICDAGNNRHEFFQVNGFRYIVLVVRDSESELRIKTVLNTATYPLERVGAFVSSDRVLESIWQTCAHTQSICSLDAYVDTPWREQAQWWGDARVQCWNTFHLCDDARLLRRGIKQIASQTTPNGLTYGHAPTMAHTCVLPDFTLMWCLTLWDFYWQTGSLEAFQTHQPTIENALHYFQEQTDETTGLVPSDKRYWLFLDWSCLPKDGTSSVLNLWLLLALDKMALLHRLNDNAEKAAELEAWAQRLRVSLSVLVNERGLLRDGIQPDGSFYDTTSAHAQTLALMAGLSGVREEEALSRVLLPFIRLEILPDRNAEITPSSYWVTYVFSVLSERGYGKEVVRFIRRHWAKMADFGSTFEDYHRSLNGESHSHAWSAHPLFHLMQTVGGLRQSAAKWDRVVFAPVFEGENGGATIPTPHGTLVSQWQKSGEEIHVSLEIPEGIEAEIALPDVHETRGAGRPQWQIKSQNAS